VYACMALGYALIGTALLAGGPGASAGRHLLTVGAIGLSIYAVICIAGRTAGIRRTNGPGWGGAVLIVAGLCCAPARPLCRRRLQPLPSQAGEWRRSGCCAGALGPVLWRVRPDGLWGCQGSRLACGGCRANVLRACGCLSPRAVQRRPGSCSSCSSFALSSRSRRPILPAL
jgi:uncharacterized protein involved in response to NO